MSDTKAATRKSGTKMEVGIVRRNKSGVQYLGQWSRWEGRGDWFKIDPARDAFRALLLPNLANFGFESCTR